MGGGQRVGVFGGAFDPPHIGHLAVARAAAEGASLDRVLWVPAAVPPHKRGRALAPAQARRRMVEAAIRDDPRFELCDLELRRGGVSYTVDTLRALRAAHPDWRLFLIVGADVLAEFSSWKSPAAVLEAAELVAVARNGVGVARNGATPGARATLAAGATLAARSAKLKLRPRVVPMPPVEVSSSEVRKRVAERKSHSAMLPSQVTYIIEREGLYRRRTAGFGRGSSPQKRTPAAGRPPWASPSTSEGIRTAE